VAASNKSLTIRHGEWPRCTRYEWKQYCSGNDITSSLARIEQVWLDYSNFIIEEDERRFHMDIEYLFEILSAMPNLKNITISDLQTNNLKYFNFQKKI